ncbi:hypothetical protein A2U01_0058096, partial [Trifolium medium]|nr:hypothetical protein [Trifolium medium]
LRQQHIAAFDRKNLPRDLIFVPAPFAVTPGSFVCNASCFVRRCTPNHTSFQNIMLSSLPSTL